MYDFGGHGNPEQNDLTDINEQEELQGERDVSLFHEGLVKTLDAQVKQVFNLLHSALNKGSVNPHASSNRVINRMTQSQSRYSKRSKTPGVLVSREPSRFQGPVAAGGTGTTNANMSGSNMTRTESMYNRIGEDGGGLEASNEEFDPIVVSEYSRSQKPKMLRSSQLIHEVQSEAPHHSRTLLD